MRPVPLEFTIGLRQVGSPEELRHRLRREIEVLLGDLAIPVDPLIRIDPDGAARAEPVTVTIDDRACENIPGPPSPGEPGTPEDVAQRLHANVEAVLTETLVGRLWSKWGGRSGSPPSEFAATLRKLVRYRLRIDRIERFVPEWREGAGGEAFEAALSEASRRVVIELHPEARRALEPELNAPDDLLGMMSDGLFYELGVHTGECVLQDAPDLDRDAMRVRLNDLRSPSLPLLRSEERLVNDTVERLRLLSIEGRFARNPANGNECAIVSASDGDRCEEAGLSVWGPAGYLVLLVSAMVRANAAVLVSREIARYYLDQLAQPFPVLHAGIEQGIGTDRFAAVLRALLEEEISVRNMPAIIEAILSAPPQITEDIDRFIAFGGTYGSLRAKLPLLDSAEEVEALELAECVRMNLRRYIAHKYTRGQSTLIVYLVAPEIEQRLRDERSLDADERQEILSATRDEVGSLPPTAQQPVVLTTATVRHRFRRELRGPFPNLAVLSYQELSPDMNIQPIARISLP